MQRRPICLVLALSALLACVLAAEIEFNVRPDKPDTVVASEGEYSCEFSYRASGGSSELWTISLVQRGKDLMCQIGRPKPPSYLYFTSFTAKLNGVTLETADVFDNNGALLQNDQFVVKSNTVSNNNGWGGVVTMIGLQGRK